MYWYLIRFACGRPGPNPQCAHSKTPQRAVSMGGHNAGTPPENTRSARAPAMSLARLLAHGDAQRLNFSAQRCQRAQGRQHDVRLRDAYEGIRHEPAVVREGLPRPVSQIKKKPPPKHTARAPPQHRPICGKNICGLAATTSAPHVEGRRRNPGQVHFPKRAAPRKHPTVGSRQMRHNAMKKRKQLT